MKLFIYFFWFAFHWSKGLDRMGHLVCKGSSEKYDTFVSD